MVADSFFNIRDHPPPTGGDWSTLTSHNFTGYSITTIRCNLSFLLKGDLMGIPVPPPSEPCYLCNNSYEEFCYWGWSVPFEERYTKWVELCGRYRTQGPYEECLGESCVYQLVNCTRWYWSGAFYQSLGFFEFLSMTSDGGFTGFSKFLAHDLGLDPTPGMFAEEVQIDNENAWCGLRTGDKRTKCLVKFDNTIPPPA